MEWSEVGVFPIEDALEMIFVFNRAGIISYANSAAKSKLEYEDELCGHNVCDIFPNTFKLTEDGFWTDYPFGHEVQNLNAYRKNRTCFPVETRIIASGDSSESYICMANDTLEKEYLSREIEHVRQEAEQALQVKSEFVANVTHEIRTPVNGVLVNVKELLAFVTDEQTLKPLRLIERCCGDMNKIINNILDFSKLEAGKFTLEPREFNFRNMLDYVRSQHINKMNEKGLRFFMTVSPQIPENVIGDELRIVQILNNLLSNALKFTSVGKITLEVVRTARVKDKMELFFIVKDTGIGIDKADKDKLFKSFSQVDASISRKFGGTGLGLNICKQLVGLMGGKIEAEGERNKGTTFSFSIWVGISEDENASLLQDDNSPMGSVMITSAQLDEEVDDTEDIMEFGTPENKEALKKNLSKLILCVEMENWEKAEMFMDTIRQLSEGAPREVARIILKLKMAVQKENYEKVSSEYEELSTFL